MDIKLHYTEHGSGEPLILLHGNGEDGSYFENQIPCFSERFRVIALDTRGHGKSPRGEGPFTLDRFSDDLKSFMDGMAIGKASILGFSDGANIAILFALKYPEHVDRLVLDGANLFPLGLKLPVWLGINAAGALASLTPGRSPELVKKKELLRLMTREPHISPKELSAISAPTLVIAGTRDMIRARHTRLIGRSIPGSRVRMIKGTHFIAKENSEEFNDCVYRFLNGEL
ncbi:MAG: alpha/beta hydrolase [Oscillospiraceae bacterium]|nr:alpha/beta hydrolase [Oscillospiraceae bacterium]